MECRADADRSYLCLNCSANTNGAFCNECGQAVSVERYSLRSLVREIYLRFRSFEAVSTYRTFKALSVEGGEFVRRYLAGKRVGFTNPIVYFFYYFILEIFVVRSLQVVTADPSFGDHGVTGFDLQVIALIATIFWGIFWWVLFRKSGLNLVENSVAALYFVAHVNIISLTFLALSAVFVSWYPSAKYLSAAATGLLYFAYGIYFGRHLFNDPIWKLIPKQLFLTVVYVVILVSVLTADIVGIMFMKHLFNQVF